MAASFGILMQVEQAEASKLHLAKLLLASKKGS